MDAQRRLSRTRRVRLGSIAATVAVAAVALIAPAPSPATTIGQLANGGELAGPPTPSCTAGRVYTQTGTNGAGNVTYDLPTSPTVITSWATTLRNGPTRLGALKVLASNGDGTFTVLATSAVETLVLSSGTNVNRFSVRIPTPGGGQLAYAPADPAGTSPAQTCYFRPDTGGVDANDNVVSHGPSAGAVGTTFTPDSAPDDRRMSIEATFEPDADVDGWGDETQDRCPLVAGDNQGCPPVVAAAPPPAPPPDRTKPVIGGLTFSRSSFAAAGSGAAFSAQKGKKRKKSAPIGTKVSFNLTEAASVRFTVQRKTTGRRVSGKCRTPSRKNRKKRKCTLWKNVTGSFTYPGKAGKNTFTFRGRIGGKALRTGSYRLNGTATDPANNTSTPRNKTFKIVK